MSPQNRWVDGAILTVLLGIHLCLGTFAVNRQAATYDEAVHLASGYNYLVTGSYSIDRNTHPPLLRVIAAVPLLGMRLNPLAEHPYAKGDLFEFADSFLYHNRVSGDAILAAGRCALFWVLSPLLCLFIYFWALGFGGRAAGASAAFLYVLCPVILANAPLVMTDFGLSVFCFAALYALQKALLSTEPRLGQEVLFGLFFGAALISKISAVILFGIIPLSIISYWGLTGNSWVLRRGSRILAVSLPLTALVVLCAYYFTDIWMYWESIRWIFTRTQSGALHINYLMGHTSTEGWWYYFPICFLLKTPLFFLFLLALAVFKCLEQMLSGLPKKLEAWRAGISSGSWASGGTAAVIAFVLLPPAIWMAIACTSKLQIGIRHILPIYPFCCVAAGIAAGQVLSRGDLLRRLGLWLLAAGYAWTAFAGYPDYLADFNSLIRDKSQSFRYLADANLDTGQGLKELGRELKSRGSPLIYLSYFGTADPHAYGIRYIPVGLFSDVPRIGDDLNLESRPGLFAISASNRAGMYYHDLNLMKWLDNYTPIQIIGHSIFLYDFSNEPRAVAEITEILKVERSKVNEAIKHNTSATHLKQGIALAAKGKLDEAIKQYLEALKIDPDYEEAHNNLGVALARLGKLDDAVKQYLEALRISPNIAKTHNNLGAALTAQGKFDEAIKHYQEALRIDPDYTNARLNLDDVQAAQSKLTK